MKEFEQVAKKYYAAGISDDGFRNETFGKLRSILMTELESHRNDANYEQFDIGCIQGLITQSLCFFPIASAENVFSYLSFFIHMLWCNTDAAYG